MATMLGSHTRMLLFQRHKRCGVKCNSIKTIKLRKPLFHITRLHSHEPSVTVEMAEPDTGTSEHLPLQKSVLEEDAPNQQHAKASGRATRRRLQQEAGRKLFYPSERSLSYLDGSLPGDYGWDPLGLADPRGRAADEPIMNLNWLSYAELIHGRWAMLAAAGALAPELLAKAGATPAATGLPWFVAGGLYTADGASVAIPFFGDLPFHYWTDQYTLLFTMLIAMGFAETRRLQDYRHPGSMGQQYFIGLERILGGSGKPAYPGGQFFNLFGLARNDESEMFRLKTAEIKHGRLAMVAFLALMVQAQSTHLGPVQNLLDHISNPIANNALVRVGDFITHTSNAERFGYVLWLAAGFAAGAVYKSARDHERDAEAAAS